MLRTHIIRYDIKDNKWTELAPMSVARSHAAIANVSGKVFVMGGRESYQAQFSSVESYDPTTNEWTTLAPMIKRRSGARAAVINGELYVLGGWNLTESLSSIEQYDPQANTWSIVSSSQQKYCSHSWI